MSIYTDVKFCLTFAVKISALEEIALRKGWITKDELLASAVMYGKSPYGEHLRRVADGKLKY